MRNNAFDIIVYYPTDEKGIVELEERVATAHAEAVLKQIQRLNSPTQQKIDLVNAIIDTVKSREK